MVAENLLEISEKWAVFCRPYLGNQSTERRRLGIVGKRNSSCSKFPRQRSRPTSGACAICNSLGSPNGNTIGFARHMTQERSLIGAISGCPGNGSPRPWRPLGPLSACCVDTAAFFFILFLLSCLIEISASTMDKRSPKIKYSTIHRFGTRKRKTPILRARKKSSLSRTETDPSCAMQRCRGRYRSAPIGSFVW